MQHYTVTDKLNVPELDNEVQQQEKATEEKATANDAKEASTKAEAARKAARRAKMQEQAQAATEAKVEKEEVATAVSEVEAKDGKQISEVSQKLAAMKTQSAHQVAEAHESALHAINSVKEHVQKLKSNSDLHKEVGKKRELSVVKRIAGKAALAVNAANLVSALRGSGGNKKASKVSSVEGLKQQVKMKMARDKKIAEDAAKQWKSDAHKLAKLESEKANKSKKQMNLAKEKTKKKMRREQLLLMKTKGKYDKIKDQEDSIEVKAKRNAKLSGMVTETFKKHPVLDREKQTSEKAKKRAAEAKHKAHVLKLAAGKQKEKSVKEKEKAKAASSTTLKKALARREDARDELKHADKAVTKAQGEHTVATGEHADAVKAHKEHQDAIAAAKPELKSSNDEETKDEAALFEADSKAKAKAAKAKLDTDIATAPTR